MTKFNFNRTLPYISLYFIIFLYSLGGICSKIGASKTFLSFEWMVLYGLLLLSLALYAVFWQQILKKIPLNTAYTLKSTGIIWTMLWGTLIFHEKLNFLHFISALFIIAGVVLMTTTEKTNGESTSHE